MVHGGHRAMEKLSRREFSQQALGSLLTYSLLETLFAHDAFGSEVRPQTVEWLDHVNQLGADAQQQKLPQLEWQKQIERLFRQVNLPDLLKMIDFDRLTRNIKMVDRGALSLSFKFPQVEGLPTHYVFGKQIFALKQDRSVVPHGHNNMATAFLILKGELRGRHYDRLEDLPNAYIIKPTIDRKFTPGECSTVSDHKDNVHWFQALTEPAFIFNIHVLNVSPGLTEPTGRVYLNPLGEKLSGGRIKAPHIDYHTSVQLFG
jgi:hypothetical protein